MEIGVIEDKCTNPRKKLFVPWLCLAGVLACYFVAGSVDADETDTDDQYLGQLSVNPYVPESVSNPYGAGNPYDANSVNNPYGTYGNPYSNKSVSNPYATDAPRGLPSGGTLRSAARSRQSGNRPGGFTGDVASWRQTRFARGRR